MVDRAALESAFAEFARALLGPYDIGGVLYRLTDRVVGVLGVDGAGVSLADEDGNLGFVTATDERIVRVEELQMEADEGPCHDAYRDSRRVVADDLGGEQRWPVYCRTAYELGCGAVAGIPMPAHDVSIGALNIYRLEPHTWDERELEVAQILADMAAAYILHARALGNAHTLAGQLQHALDSRVVIEQAKGMIAARNGVDPAEAFTRLRDHARHRGRVLHEVAAEVVAGDLQL